MTPEQTAWFGQTFERLTANVELAVLGKRGTVGLALTCMLAGGHLLLEDVPGTGKTSLARALANSVRGTHARIQFTPDLLPSDVTGVTVFDQSTRSFEFHRGPVFATIVLADEINRASPKTQSSLLEVMEEGRVTVDGVAHEVGQPFMVVATQNPIEQAGTYRLPEAQLDRFLIRTSLGYPDLTTTVRLLAESAVRDRARDVQPIITGEVVSQMIAMASEVHVDTALLEYVATLLEATRATDGVSIGVSVRGGQSLVRAARAWAAGQGRAHVVPDDVKFLAGPVLSHRICLDPEAELAGFTGADVVSRALQQTAPPRLARA